MIPDCNITLNDTLFDAEDNTNLLSIARQSKFDFGHGCNSSHKYHEQSLRFVSYIQKKVWSNYKSTKDKLSSLIPGGYRADHAYINLYQPNTETLYHRDSKSLNDITILVFFCETWEKSWGGELLFFSDNSEIHQFIEFKPARAIVFNSNMEHWAKSGNTFSKTPRYSLAIKLKPNE